MTSEPTEFAPRVMSDEQRRAVALEYLRRVDDGEDVLPLFAERARVHFPKWGIARGKSEIAAMFGDLGKIVRSIRHHHATLNVLTQGDLVVLEGTSEGVTASGKQWRAGGTMAGPWCDIFEIRDFRIQRLHVYLDPDYGDEDIARYPWLRERGPSF